MKNKELLLIVKCLKQFQGILFGYEIDVFSNLENLVYEEKISASQIFMQWRLILKQFGPNTHRISLIENKLADNLSCQPLANIDRDESSTMNDSRRENEIFAFNNDEDEKVNFPLALPLVQREQQK